MSNPGHGKQAMFWDLSQSVDLPWMSFVPQCRAEEESSVCAQITISSILHLDFLAPTWQCISWLSNVEGPRVKNRMLFYVSVSLASMKDYRNILWGYSLSNLDKVTVSTKISFKKKKQTKNLYLKPGWLGAELKRSQWWHPPSPSSRAIREVRLCDTRFTGAFSCSVEASPPPPHPSHPDLS